MAFSALENLTLGKAAMIAFQKGMTDQLSKNVDDFKDILSYRIAKPEGRHKRFLVRSGRGPAAVQMRNPNGSTAFPRAFQGTINEGTFYFKEANATIRIEQNLMRMLQLTPGDKRYTDEFIGEIEGKTISAQRDLGKQFYMDGTGVIGEIQGSSGAVVTSPTSGSLVFQLSTEDGARGHVGLFELDDYVVLKAAAGTTSAINTSLATEPVYWQVVALDRSLDQVTLKGYDTNFAATATISSVTTPPADGEVFYRLQPTVPDLTGTISDYGTITECLPGLESLSANDGRVVHGLTMTGALAGTRYGCGANAIDFNYFDSLMSTLLVNVGRGRKQYTKARMAPEVRSALVDAHASDRRFVTLADTTHGVQKIGYAFEKYMLEFNTSEFCPKMRVYVVPDDKGDEAALEFHLTDVEDVQNPDNGSSWHLDPGAGANIHGRAWMMYLQWYGTLVCKHPRAIGVLNNYTWT